ncbi:YchF/TatD family DNA exonuclease [Rodentibacter caecimuris]|uniref:Metal-dependent hydrolase n=1 Tax=Rodentibacter caecimuris TaxID=1796644 RepID=A0ABX3KXC5_9PAST|nr:metal-dependent hydrolase [Rodentibacter heylii]
MFIVDSHCHLDALDYDNLHRDIADVVQKANAREVKHLLAVGVTLSRFEQALPLLTPFKEISLACGIHPLNISDEPYDKQYLYRLAKHPKVIAIGEIGLDYYYSAKNKAEQQHIFADQIQLANELNKPVIVHTRSAKEDTIALLCENQVEKCSGILHCFTEDLTMATQALELGMYISISGIITFRNAESLRDVVRHIPVDRLLVETDSPYLAPVPYRGKQNQPAYTREVCEYVATLKGLSTEDFAQKTTENFERLFKINVQ